MGVKHMPLKKCQGFFMKWKRENKRNRENILPQTDILMMLQATSFRL